jgi:hypothetical protein
MHHSFQEAGMGNGTRLSVRPVKFHPAYHLPQQLPQKRRVLVLHRGLQLPEDGFRLGNPALQRLHGRFLADAG